MDGVSARDLRRLGWTHAGNLQIEHRWVSDSAWGRSSARRPNLLPNEAGRDPSQPRTGGVMVSALKQQTRIIPIVFALYVA